MTFLICKICEILIYVLCCSTFSFEEFKEWQHFLDIPTNFPLMFTVICFDSSSIKNLFVSQCLKFIHSVLCLITIFMCSYRTVTPLPVGSPCCYFLVMNALNCTKLPFFPILCESYTLKISKNLF